MKTPKIIFSYSWIYDSNWRKWITLYRNKKGKYPDSKETLSYIKKISSLWDSYNKKILSELSKIARLKWKKKMIKCYVVGKCVPFSDPLTLPIYQGEEDYFIDVLIHELIHQLFTQEGNIERSKKAWEYIDKNYEKESHTTRIHVPLHAIHSHIYNKFFNKKRLNRDIKRISFLPDYRRSWEIVQKEGYKNILNEFTRRIK